MLRTMHDTRFNVDVYYWPEAHTDDSCLSIIGTSLAPDKAAAKTDSQGTVYWADTTDRWDIYAPTRTIARIITVNGIEVKESLLNPWAETTSAIPSSMSQKPSNVHERDRSLITSPPCVVDARPRSLVKRSPQFGADGTFGVNSTFAGNGSTHDSVVVLDGHTL